MLFFGSAIWRGRVGKRYVEQKRRGVAQFGSALGSGPRGRGFKSRHLDHKRAEGFCLPLFCFYAVRLEPATS